MGGEGVDKLVLSHDGVGEGKYSPSHRRSLDAIDSSVLLFSSFLFLDKQETRVREVRIEK